MKALRRKTIQTLLAAALASVAATPTVAQEPWKPEKRVTIVVPYSPGGGTDAVARAIGRQLQEQWNQPVIIENVPGADGLIGTRKVMESQPDGYTLLVQLPSMLLLKHLPSFKGEDPVTKLEPVAGMAEMYGVIVADPKLPGATMAEAIQHCRTAAQPCTFGTTENVARINARMLSDEADVKNLIVLNYKGGGQLVTDLVGGSVNLTVMGITAALPYQKSGQVRILATMGPKRTPALPDVPTTAEAGFPYLNTVTWYGLFAPIGTPSVVKEGVGHAVREAVNSPNVQKVLGTLGADLLGTSPTEFSEQVKKGSERIQELVQKYPLQ